MNNEEINKYIEKINNMTHRDMCIAYRFAKCGDPIFDNRLPLYIIFKKRFDAFGGFTPEISKDIGWD